MNRLFLKAVVAVGITVFLFSVAMLYIDRHSELSPLETSSGATKSSTIANTEAQARQEAEIQKPSITINSATQAGKWVGGWYVFPIGPCTMVVKLGGSYWFTLPRDETRYYSDDIDSAKEAASAACDKWYANEMAGRLAVQRANEELAR